MRKFKLFLTLLMVAILGCGQMWGATTVNAQNYEFTQSSTPTGWTVGSSNTQDANYLKLSAGDYLQMTTATIFTANEVLSSSTMDVEVSCGTFGTWSDEKSVKVTVELRKSDGTVLSTANSTFSSLTNKEGAYKSAISVSKPSDPSQISYLRVTFSDYGSSGAVLRVKNVRLTYETDASLVVTPTLTCATTELSFTAETGSTDQKQFTFSGSDLTANAGLAISGDNAGLFSVEPESVDKGTGTITNSQVTVTYTPTAVGNHSATLTISSTGATSKTISLTGSATAPAIKHKAFFYNGETLLNTGGTEFAEGAAVSYSGETPESCETGTGKSGTFVGWADGTWTGKKTAKSDITDANFYEGALPVMGTSDVNYYAVFANVVPGTTTWSLTAIGDLSSTDVFVIADADNYAFTNDNGTGSAVGAVSLTVSEGKITSTVDDNIKWNISGNATNGYTFYPNGDTETWLYCNTSAASGSNNNMRVGAGQRKVFEINSSGYFVTKDESTLRYICRYNNADFRGYINLDYGVPVQNPKFYKESTTPGTTSNYITGCAAPGTCIAPDFSKEEGTYVGTQSISLSSGTEGASIYYTIGMGTEPANPTDGSTLYEGPISVTANTTIKAIAYKDGMIHSDVSSATYTIKCVAPTFSPAAGTFESAQTVSISSGTADAVIYYTTDNWATSVPYTDAINVTETQTIKAKATKIGMTDSEESVALYTINYPRTVTFHVGTGSLVAPATSPMTEVHYGDGITLPSAAPSSYCAAEGWTFAGWATSASTTTAPTLLANTPYDCASTDLYAVYKKGDENYHLVTTLPTGDDIPGTYLIVNTEGKVALEAAVKNTNYLYGCDITTIENNVINPTAMTNPNYRVKSIWQVTYESSKWIFYNENTQKYLYNFASGTNHYVGLTDSKPSGYTISLSGGFADFTSADDNGAHINWASSYSNFAGTTGDTKNLHLYKLDVTYAYEPVCCDDEVTIAVTSPASGFSFEVEQNSVDVIGHTLSTCTGSQVVTVTCHPALNHHVESVVESIANDAYVTGSGNNWTITYPQGATGTSTITVTFAEDSEPAISTSVDNIPFGDVAEGSNQTYDLTVSAVHLTGTNLSISSNNAKFTLSKNDEPISNLPISAGEVSATTITVTFDASEVGEYSGKITLSDGVTSKEITVSANAKKQYTINWYNEDALLSESAAYLAGATIVKPASDPTACAGMTFVGWLPNATITGKQATAPDNFIAKEDIATAVTTATASVDYHAVFAKVTEGGWKNTALTALTSMDVFVIVGNNGDNYAMSNANGASSAPAAVEVTVADGKITGTVDDNLKWNISGNATEGYTFYPNGSTTTWLYCLDDSNNGVRVGNTEGKNVFTIEQGYLYTTLTTYARHIGVYNSQDWRCYKPANNGDIASNISGQTFAFFKYSAPTAKDYMTTCAVTFDITYEAGAGTGEDYVVSNIAQNASHTVLGNDVTLFTKEGYKFNGWKENGTDRAAGYVYEHITADLTFIAQWQEKTAAGLVYDPTIYEAEMNSTFAAPSVNNPNGLTVTYSSGDPSKATVDPATGAVTLVPNAVGDVIITASSAETDTYKAGSASYTIKIGEAQASQTAPWVAATELYDGMQVLLVGYKTSNTTYYSIGSQNANNRSAVAGTLSEGIFTPGAGAKVFTLEDQNDGTYAIKTSTGEYLYAAASGDNHMKTQATVDANAKWTITLSDGGVASIIAESSSNRNVMLFNHNNTLFSCYTNDEGDYTSAITLYTPQVYKRNVSGNYGTICLPKAGVLTNGTLFEIAYYGETSKKIFFDELLSNEMVAGRPYLFKPNESVTELIVNYTDNASVAAGNWKGLHGFYNLDNANATFNIEQDAGNYIMYSNQYWSVSGRAAYIENYRAYIVLSDITTVEPAKAPGTRRVSLNVNGEQTATDIDALNASETPVKMMIDGNLYILRGEKMYDATGRLVK